MILCATYDKVANVFSEPFTAVNEAVAIRSIKTAALKNPTVALNSKDYVLYKIADYDETNGDIANIKHVQLAELRDLFKEEEIENV